jgi:hypothetical protein
MSSNYVPLNILIIGPKLKYRAAGTHKPISKVRYQDMAQQCQSAGHHLLNAEPTVCLQYRIRHKLIRMY